jgi:alkylhydroperoxidase family enzyme
MAYSTDAERAALALTEAVTRLGDRADPVPESPGTRLPGTTTSRLAALLIAVATINGWNRLDVATRQVGGR